MQAEYGVDLEDLWRRGSDLTWRRLGVLIRQLPPTSRYAAALAGVEVWSAERYMLADLVDLAQVNALLLSAMASGRQFRTPPVSEVTPVQRPGGTPEPQDAATQQELMAWFGGVGTARGLPEG